MNQTNINDFLKRNNVDEGLSSLINCILLACTEISQQVEKGELAGILGSAEQENVQGETQKKLDVISNEILKKALLNHKLVKTLASEEEDNVVIGNEKGAFIVAFDPLDGSSNIDVNGQIGTIFTIYAAKADIAASCESQFYQKGDDQLCAGYVLYGAATLLVLTVNTPTSIFTLDKSNNEYILSNNEACIPKETQEFSVNISNFFQWSELFRSYITELIDGKKGKRKKKFNMRWNGSMVGDMHRIICRGGIFCYPSDVENSVQPAKLRLLYEASPLAILVENAGGKAYTESARILDITPEKIHQRVPVIMGSATETDTCFSFLSKPISQSA